MRTNTSPATRPTAACPKCAGTGVVSRFLDYKGGVCFDCGGTGRVEAPASTAVTTLSTARKVGDMARTDATTITAETATAALAALTEYGMHRWGTNDYHRQRALLAIVNG
jgi:DnaJ-class molecular chaperone